MSAFFDSALLAYFFSGAAGAGAAAGAETAAAGAEAAGAGAATGAGAGVAAFSPQADKESANNEATSTEYFIL